MAKFYHSKNANMIDALRYPRNQLFVVDKINKKKAAVDNDELEYFQSIVEPVRKITPHKIAFKEATEKITPVYNKVNINSRGIESKQNLEDIKQLLDQVLAKLSLQPFHNEIDQAEDQISKEQIPQRNLKNRIVVEKAEAIKRKKQDNCQDIWGEWTQWSNCSVTCGKGRRIRWRHCISKECAAETEMEEKSCQMPECSPFKLFEK